jgi:hypothetical protein
MLSPKTFVQFQNESGVLIFSSHNQNLGEMSRDNFVVSDLNRVPWKIAVKCSLPNKNKIIFQFHYFF